MRYIDDRPFYRGANDALPTDVLASYYTIDLRAQKRLTDHWQMSLTMNNIFDTEYSTYVAPFIDNDPFNPLVYSRNPGAGRSFFFQVRYSY